MSQRMHNILSGLVMVGFAASAHAITVGGYAVADHSDCGISNIPKTVTELDKFFASKDLPAIGTKNFYWSNARVRQNQWIKDGDYKKSTEAAAGYDGADASLLTYIASHGVTSNGLYKALSGSTENGGCYIPSSSLEIGNQTARYAVLSTCQGLKIGTGDSPTSNGENPSKTWKTSAKGMNCIFGYSNNMADEDDYGVFFLEKIKTGQTTLAEAFMTSSEAVAKDNIPAVLCFGTTQDDAANYIKSNKTFEANSRPAGASAWVYRKFVDNDSGAKSFAQKFAPGITVAPIQINPGRVAKAFLGASVNSQGTKGALTTYTSEAGTASYDEQTNVLQITNNLIDSVRNDEVPSVEESAEIAANAVKASGLNNMAGTLTLVGHADDVLGGEDGVQKVIQRKFSFKQALEGFQTLGQAGSIEVAIGPGGAVANVTASLLKVTGKESGFVQGSHIAAVSEDIESAAIHSVGQKVPGANMKVISTRYGYDTGSFFGFKSKADAVAEVVVEAEQGGFARRYIEKIKL